MYNAKILLAAAVLAGSSLAQSPASTDPAACAASASSILRGAPTPAPALGSYLAAVFSGPVTAPGQTIALPRDSLADPEGYKEFFCGLARQLPPSLLPEFKSHGSALLSYGSAHVSDYDAYITSCITTGDAASTLTSELHEMFTGTGAACPKAHTVTTGSSNGTFSYPTRTSTGSKPHSTAPTSLVPTAAAARHTGTFVGAAAIGGLLGAVAML